MSIASLFKSFTATLLAFIASISFSLGTAIGATDGTPINATRHSYCFDNSGILIGGYNYDLKNTDQEHIGYIKDADIDFMITSVNEQFLDLCDQNKVGVIATNYNASSMYYMTYGNTSWYDISKETYKDHPCLWGDNMIDEPTSKEFKTLSDYTKHYYANTDGKLPYINLFPIYASSEQLGNVSDIPLYRKILLLGLHDATDDSVDRYKKHVSDYINTIDTDYISADIYPLGQKKDSKGVIHKETNPGWLRNLDILGEACRSTNRDLWVITQAAGYTDENGGGNRYCNTPEDIRWQAYTSFSFGAKAIIHACYNGGWWDTDSHLIDANGNRTETYYAVKTVDKEIKAFSDIYGNYQNKGAFLHNGLLAAGSKAGYLLPVDNQYKPAVKSASPLLIGCFSEKQGNGKAYTVVNMAEPDTKKAATAELTFDNATKITVYRKGIATVYNANKITLPLDSCEGVFITVE